ncbi:MAG: AAA family ATPase [Chloroflexi bacterium]|nr:AAA family ATPase [Chloroflexota bacterium]
MKELLERYIKARYALIAVVSHEESRVMQAIEKLSKEMRLTSGKKVPRKVVEWTITQGLVGVDDIAADEYADPNAALGWVAKFDEEGDEPSTLFVFKDLHKLIESDVRVVRYLRDISSRFQTRKHNLILLSPSLSVHPDLEKQVAVIDWSLPDVKELEAILSKAESNLPNTTPVTLNGNRDQVVQAMRGLTEEEAENVLTAGVVACGELGDGVISHIIAEKKQIIRKSGVLEYFEANVSMSDVGGLENLKAYAARKRLAMSPKARAAGVDSPKGVLLVGVPGTGKSLSAKAIAGGTLPLLRFDMSKILGSGRVGAAENNISTALKVAEATAPCVLWLDEIEKALADNGGASDGGVMMRVIGSLLTWMQETTSPVYVIATANSVSALRPELLSRFDDVMFVDLPDARSRLQILDVHMGKRGVKIKANDFDLVINATWGFSGREIEKVVKFAVERAFFDNKPVEVSYLLEAAKQIVPTSETKKDEIKALREWAKGKALTAGNPLEAEPKAKSEGKRTMEV